MAQAIRQSELFAGNDWLVLHKAFSQVNLNSFDFDSIRASMVNYIRINYPEDFNDWIDSSEFVAILDLLAYLGQSLAFRMDLNARENFIDIARRRESVLRLAKFLSYSPSRNKCASGLVKIVQVITTNDIYDSFGNNLNGMAITWNDSTNSNWYDQWIQVMNDMFVNTNPFGTPLNSAAVHGVPAQLYRVNNIPNSAGNFPFTATVNNNSYDFDIINANFTSSQGFFENDPDPVSLLNVIYQNDSNGNNSIHTGFFLMFKQGSLLKTDYNIANYLENRILDINIENVNQSDVWVHSVNDAGSIVANGIWSRLGYIPTDDVSKILMSVDNVTYNSIKPNIQHIFQVLTQVNDQISIRFGDGRFGQIPMGNIRIWHRVSANENLIIRPEEMQTIQIQVDYIASNLTHQTMTFTFDLQETISNASVSESNDDIRRHAGSVYNTQGRMVSGSDYNALPATNTTALKVKAVNRVYSGQSRYIDLNDPTGTYQNTKIFSDDGSIYKDIDNNYQEIALSANYSTQQLGLKYIYPQLASVSLQNFIYDYWLNNLQSKLTLSNLYWNEAVISEYSNTGFLSSGGLINSSNSNLVIAGLGSSNSIVRNILSGSMIKFKNAGWMGVVSVDVNNNTGINSNGQGQIQLTSNVLTGDMPISVLPNFRTSLVISESTLLNQQFGTQRGFGLGFNYISQSWYFIDITNINTTKSYDISTNGSNSDSSWLIRCEYSPLNWRIYTRNLSYVFESAKDVKFFFVNSYKTINQETGQSAQDIVDVLKYNLPKGVGDITFDLVSQYSYSDGFLEPSRVFANFADSNDDGFPDNPESFSLITSNNGITMGSSSIPLVFHQSYIDINGYDSYSLCSMSTIWYSNVSAPLLGINQIGYEIPISGDITSGTFYIGTYEDINQQIMINMPLSSNNGSYTVSYGSSGLSFKWQHYAPLDHRIDPAVTNIIDVLILDNGYYTQMQSWYANGCDPLNIPSPPTEDALSIIFSELEPFKTFSDEIVWRPASLKLLFGSGSASELKASIKVVPLPGTTISNGEIQSRVISAIQTYFNVNSWDFGETFYWSELSGYLHSQLVNAISSIALVPLSSNQYFGDLFEIHCLPNELFFPTITVNDIIIISANTESNLRVK